VYAQPLVLAGVGGRKGKRNLVYIATMHNMVYAFDADSAAQVDPVWVRALESSVRLPDSDVGGGGGYSDISFEVGIVSTPVIDRSRNALYVVAFSKESGKHVHRLHMLDCSTGNDIAPPIVIDGSVSCRGKVTAFDSSHHNQRSGLLLAFDRVYAAFGSYGDNDPYHGWVISFSFDQATSTLKREQVFNSTPCGDEGRGGIWMAAQAPAADGNGVYVMTGNGSFHKSGSDLGDSIVKLSPALTLVDYFSPFNNADLSGNDQDLGSAGILLIPDAVSRRPLLIGGGKEGKLYLVDRNSMGKIEANDSQIVQSFLAYASGDGTHHIHGSPVFWNGPGGPLLYIWTENDALRAFHFNGSSFDRPPAMVSQTSEPDGIPGGARGMPGGILSVSANGSRAGTGVLWASHPYQGDANQKIVPGVLRAYDASDLSAELWNSRLSFLRDDVGNFAKFSPPTIANGKVYLAGMGGLETKTVFDESASGGPALASLGPRVAVAWTGTDQHLNVATTADGLSLVSKVTTAETSDHGPSLCFRSGTLFLAWTGTDSHLNVVQSTDGGLTWGSKTTLPDTSDASPALACDSSNLYLAWTGTDGQLNVSNSANGVNWTAPPSLHPMNERSDTGPSLTLSGSVLYLVWTGTDNRLNVVSSSAWPTFANKVTLSETSDHRAAMVQNGPFYIAWAGRDSDHRLNLQVSNNGAFKSDYKATYGDASENGLALVLFRQRVYVAWTGTDSHLNLAVLSPGEFHVFGLLP
jgi:hypothetical protein